MSRTYVVREYVGIDTPPVEWRRLWPALDASVRVHDHIEARILAPVDDVVHEAKLHRFRVVNVVHGFGDASDEATTFIEVTAGDPHACRGR
jgi:hypothetical protein